MKVSFWSPSCNDCAVTSNLACISILFSNMYPFKSLIIENHLQRNKIKDLIHFKSNYNYVCENKNYYERYTGMNSILYDLSLMHNTYHKREPCLEDLVKMLENVTEEILCECLFYISTDNRTNKMLFELGINKHIRIILKASELFADLTFIDTGNSNVLGTKEVLDEADLIIVNLSQDPNELHNFFKNYYSILSRSFILISKYDKKSYYNLKKITQTYLLDKSNVATIPYNAEYKEALRSGKLIGFLINNFNCKKCNQNYYFMSETIKATEKIYNIISSLTRSPK